MFQVRAPADGVNIRITRNTADRRASSLTGVVINKKASFSINYYL